MEQPHVVLIFKTKGHQIARLFKNYVKGPHCSIFYLEHVTSSPSVTTDGDYRQYHLFLENLSLFYTVFNKLK